jgi:uracil-DNA glycosylase family 4
MNEVYGYGPSYSPIIFVGEAPGELEEYEGRPFVGPTGTFERHVCKDAGIDFDNYYKTNIEKVRPPGNKLKRFKEIGRHSFQDMDMLWQELDAIEHCVIVGLGGHALEGLTGKKGITKWRGSILPSLKGGHKVVCTWHPASFFSHKESDDDVLEENKGATAWKFRTVMVMDHQRALQESLTREFNLPKRTLQISNSSADLYRFLRQYENKTLMSLDIETRHGIPICLGIAFNSYHGLCVPLLSLPEWPIDRNDLVQTWILITELLTNPNKRIIGQNWKFDERKIETILGIKIKAPLHFDCGMGQHVLYPEFPKALSFTASTWTREPYWKDEYKEYDPRKDDIRQVFYYNCKDVCVPFEIYEKMSAELEERRLTSFYFDFVNHFHGLYRRIEDRGFLFDPDMQKELSVKYNSMWKTNQEELNSIAGFEVNVASPKDVPNCLYGAVGLPFRKKCDEATLVKLLGNHAKTNEQIRAIELVLYIRRIRRTISAYINAQPDYDGRMRTLYNINGTESGRTTTNILDPPERPTKLGTSFQVLTKHGEIGPDYRKVMRADKGRVIGSLDLRQAEPRIVGLLSRDEWLLDCFANGRDVHSITASWCFDKEDRVESVSPEERFVGKCARNGYAYGEKKGMLAISVNNDCHKFNIDYRISEWKAGKVIEKFDEKCPNVKGVFQYEVREAAKANNFTLINAFGRPRQFFGRQDDRLWNEMYAQVPSSTVADKIKTAMLEVERLRIPVDIILDAHDAFAWMVDENLFEETAQEIKEIVESPIDFEQCSLPRDPILIPVEFEMGYTYGDMHKCHIS